MTAVPALAVEDLSVEFRTRSGTVKVLERVAFEVDKGETVALVGESGSGKSVTAFAVMGILDAAGKVTSGRAMFGGSDLLALSEHDLAEQRGRELSMIFQNPRTALNPIRRVGQQIADVLVRHGGATGPMRQCVTKPLPIVPSRAPCRRLLEPAMSACSISRARQALRRGGKRLLFAVDEVSFTIAAARRSAGGESLWQIHPGAPDQPPARSDLGSIGLGGTDLAAFKASAFAANPTVPHPDGVPDAAIRSTRAIRADAIADPSAPENVRRLKPPPD